MSFGNLAAERQPDSGASRLCGEEWDEEIGCSGNARAFIVDPDFDTLAIFLPTNRYPAASLQCGVGSVAQQIDEQLIQLVRIAGNSQRRPLRQRTWRRVSIPTFLWTQFSTSTA